jgi:DNA polymerase-1
VVALYARYGLTEDDALVQARVARICRASDYDFKDRKVIHWTPR